MDNAFSHYETDRLVCPRGSEAVILDKHLDFYRGDELVRSDTIRYVYCERTNGSCMSFNIGRQPDCICWDCGLAD